MNYSIMIKEKINKYNELEIIDAQQIYINKCKDIPEQTFYKVISRMTKSGEIERLTKGIYCRPRVGRFGRMVSSEKHVLEHYLGENGKSGVAVGYRMYNKYNLTTQISKVIEVYSNKSAQEKKKVLNVEIKKVNLRFDSSTTKLIELLDFLENINGIEDLNRKNAVLFIEDAIAFYQEKTFEKINRTIGYKKSTIASLRNVLDYYQITHSVDKYLNGLSTYNSIRMEDLYEFAQ